MILKIIDGEYSICKLDPVAEIPSKVFQSGFYSVSKTEEELSIVCESKHAPTEGETEDNWALIKVQGPLDFGLTGILASLATPLAAAKISIFAISTFDTDYILVKKDKLNAAKEVLQKAQFHFI